MLYEEPTFKRSRAHDYITKEVNAVRHEVGCIEIANFAKHLVARKRGKIISLITYYPAGTIPQKLDEYHLHQCYHPKEN